jgi:hypothetical protein
VKAGKSVAFADIVTSSAKAEREGTLHERLRFLARASLLVIDEIGYLSVIPGGRQFVLPAPQRLLREGRYDDLLFRKAVALHALVLVWARTNFKPE